MEYLAKSNKANLWRKRCAFVYAMDALSEQRMDEQVKYWFQSAVENPAQVCGDVATQKH